MGVGGFRGNRKRVRLRRYGIAKPVSAHPALVFDSEKTPRKRRKKPGESDGLRPGQFPVDDKPFDNELYKEELKKKHHLIAWALHGGRASRRPLLVKPKTDMKTRKKWKNKKNVKIKKDKQRYSLPKMPDNRPFAEAIKETDFHRPPRTR